VEPPTPPQRSAAESLGKQQEQLQGQQALDLLAQAQRRLDEIRRLEEEQRQAAARLEEREQALQSRAEAVEAAARELEHRSSQPLRDVDAASPNAALEALRRERDEARRLAERLSGELEAAQARERKLAQRLQAARSETAAQRQALDRRRARLQAVRKALQLRAKKLLQVRDAIRAQAREAQALLKQREAIEQEKIRLAGARRKLAAKLKKRDASVLFAALSVGLAALLAISWAAAERLAPPMYAAQAQLAPTATEAAPAVVEGWRTSLKKLLEDPRFVDAAAARLKRRGLVELGSPAALTALLRQRLDTAPTGPAGLRLTLLERGEQRAKLVLDTLLATAVSLANDARRLGAEGLSTQVASPPAVVGAVEDRRLVVAAAIFAGGATLLLGLAFAVASRAWRTAKALQDDDAPLPL